ncbi:MAG: hypothetical protein JSU03_00920 [Bacteroidetes bacterium]|nr:hypothetical protein [Bacteroidota bacterium]MBS1755814.1 hypothetical protein [Bacteroidota bacterium]
MKKLTTTMLLALCISVSAFAAGGKSVPAANETNVSKNVTASFLQDFKDAGNVSWKKTAGFYFAEFSLQDQTMSAAYDEQGVLVGKAHTLRFSDLPMAAQDALKDRFPKYSFDNTVSEVIYDGETNYYVGAESKTKTLKIKCSPAGNINVEKTMKKQILPVVY